MPDKEQKPQPLSTKIGDLPQPVGTTPITLERLKNMKDGELPEILSEILTRLAGVEDEVAALKKSATVEPSPTPTPQPNPDPTPTP